MKNCYVITLCSGGSDNKLKSFFTKASSLEELNVIANNTLEENHDMGFILCCNEIDEWLYPSEWNSNTPFAAGQSPSF